MTPENASYKDKIFTELMKVYWLRPETAVWRTLDCLALRDVEFKGPILDLGCGDGLFSFIRAGGELSMNYDMFLQAGNLDSFFEGQDIYNFHAKDAILPEVTRETDYKIDMGLDHKTDLLEKAGKLGFYKELRETDANTELPVDSDTYRTVYSNILYWLPGYKETLKEIRRVLRSEGKAVLQVPNDTLREYSFYQKFYKSTGDKRFEWLKYIDRNRSDNIKLCKSFEDWKRDFDDAGLTIVDHKHYMSKTVMLTWDIGLRPISPVLIEMANSMTLEKRSEIKRKWIDIMQLVVKPLCRLTYDEDNEYPPAFHLFILEKNNLEK